MKIYAQFVQPSWNSSLTTYTGPNLFSIFVAIIGKTKKLYYGIIPKNVSSICPLVLEFFLRMKNDYARHSIVAVHIKHFC